MAECYLCKQEMTDPRCTGCLDGMMILFSDCVARPIRYGKETRKWEPQERCPDCGVSLGRVHHPGCDMEQCPKCQGQLISCGCLDKDQCD